MKVFSKVLLAFLLMSVFSLKMPAQGSPEKFSKEFLNAFINYNEEKLKALIPADPKVQADMLRRLKELYTKQEKPIKTATMTTSVRAVLKDGTKEFKQIADIIITINPDPKTTYELTLW